MLMQICHGGKKLSLRPWFVLVSAALILNACSENRAPVPHAVGSDSLSYGILIPQTALLARSWEVPHNPMKVRPSDDSALTKSITHGYELFMNTPQIALSLAGNAMSCNNCHPNGGQRDRAMPLVGIAKVFPEYNKRSGRIFSLEDRIIGCLLRSLTWISSFAEIGKDVPWRGRNSLQPSALLPLEKLNPKLGKELYIRACSTCHGSDGQGVDVGGKRPGPLWGPNSWNDGAGAARTYTLAGMIRRWMPYLNPSLLSDEQAQHIAAYITSQPRPGFPFKNKDYLKEKIPVDAVYYKQLYSQNPLTQK
jgi:thiosulfate dehydrogenase